MTSLDECVAHVSVTDKGKSNFRRYLPLKIGLISCSALVDSGNLWRNVINTDLMKKLGLTPADLRPLERTKIATAKAGADLTVLGEVRAPLYLSLGGTGVRIKDYPVVVEGLNMAFNLCGPFMKKHGIDQLHSEDSISHHGKKIKLLRTEDETDAQGQMHTSRVYVMKRTIIPSYSVKHLPVRASAVDAGTMSAGAGYVCGAPEFMERFDVHPMLNALVTAGCQGDFVAGIMNTLPEDIVIPKGTWYGSFTLAVDSESSHQFPERIATLGLQAREPKSTSTLGSTSGRPVLIQAQVPNEELSTLERAQRIVDTFKLTETKCLEEPASLRAAVRLIDEFKDVFSYDGSFGMTNLVQHRILTEDCYPVKTRNRPINPVLEISLAEQLEVWKKHDVIEPSNSPWSFAMVAVPKKTGGTRWCVDYRRLNDVTIKDTFPLPNIDDNLARLSKASIFSGLDGCGAYHVIKIDKRDREKTAFATPWGSWQFCRMPFGLTNAPATYCRLVQMVLQGIPQSVALAYIDDTVVHSTTLPEHFDNLRRVFQAHRRAGLRLQPAKCQLFRPEIEYLGHMVSQEGITPVPRYTEIVRTWPLPRTRTEARAFLGKVGYYRKFIPDFSAKAGPWTDVTGKVTPTEEQTDLTITPEMIKSFATLRTALVTTPILAFPDFNSPEPFIVDTDWSLQNNAIGGVLSQVQDGKERVIAYGAKKLSASQRNYASNKGELAAVIYFLKLWRYYLRHRKFLLRTDHQSLKYMHSMEEPTGMVARWLETLSSHDFEIKHRPGTEHGNADSLSRVSHAEAADEEIDNDEEMLASLSTEKPKWTPTEFRNFQLSDPELAAARDWLETGHVPGGQERKALSHDGRTYLGVLPHLKLDKRRLICQKVGSRWRRCLPRALWTRTIQYVHRVGAHMGRDSTYQRIARTFFWPAMKRTVADVVRACAVCQTKGNHPPKDQKHTLTSTQDGYAFQRISIDFVGPFPISTRGNRYILTVKDTFTRWIEAFPVANADASTVCRLLDEQIFCRFGLPERIHADNGTHFTARRLRELADILGIEVTHTPAYNPKSNPVERSHRDLGPALKVFC